MVRKNIHHIYLAQVLLHELPSSCIRTQEQFSFRTEFSSPGRTVCPSNAVTDRKLGLNSVDSEPDFLSAGRVERSVAVMTKPTAGPDRHLSLSTKRWVCPAAPCWLPVSLPSLALPACLEPVSSGPLHALCLPMPTLASDLPGLLLQRLAVV